MKMKTSYVPRASHLNRTVYLIYKRMNDTKELEENTAFCVEEWLRFVQQQDKERFSSGSWLTVSSSSMQSQKAATNPGGCNIGHSSRLAPRRSIEIPDEVVDASHDNTSVLLTPPSAASSSGYASTAAAKIAELEERLAEANTRIEEQYDKITELEEEVKSLERDKEAGAAKLVETNAYVEELEEELAELQANVFVNELKDRIQELEDEVENLKHKKSSNTCKKDGKLLELSMLLCVID